MNYFLTSIIDSKIDSFPSSTISNTRGSLGREGKAKLFWVIGYMGCSSISYAIKVSDYCNFIIDFYINIYS